MSPKKCLKVKHFPPGTGGALQDPEFFDENDTQQHGQLQPLHDVLNQLKGAIVAIENYTVIHTHSSPGCVYIWHAGRVYQICT